MLEAYLSQVYTAAMDNFPLIGEVIIVIFVTWCFWHGLTAIFRKSSTWRNRLDGLLLFIMSASTSGLMIYLAKALALISK